MPPTSPAVAPGGRRLLLDGLRGVLLLAIIGYHARLPVLAGGFWALDVFFVLSGYLIASLLRRELCRQGRIDLRSFWLRRARRLLPALAVVLVATNLLARFVLDPVTWAPTRRDTLASLVYVQNWVLISHNNAYFLHTEQSPLRHLWSLSVEEQFYLLFPLLLLALAGVRWLRGGSRIGWLLVAAAIAGAQWTAWLVARDPLAIYDASRLHYGTDTRSQQFLLGAALAWFLPPIVAWVGRGEGGLEPLPWWRRWRAGLVLVAGLWGGLGLLALFGLTNDELPLMSQGGLTLTAVLAVALLLGLDGRPGWRGWAPLRWRPLVRVGVTSYSGYLWHWPVQQVLLSRTDLPSWPRALLGLAITLALAELTQRFVEDPIRGGWLGRVRSRRYLAYAAWPLVAGTTTILMLGATSLPSGAAGTAYNAADPPGTTTSGRALRVLVVGDSVGSFLDQGQRQRALPQLRVIATVRFGCGTLPQRLARPDGSSTDSPECAGQFASWTQTAARTAPDVVLWMLGPWEVLDHSLNGQRLVPGTPSYAAALTSALEQGLAALPPGQPVVLPTVPCYRPDRWVFDGIDVGAARREDWRGARVNDVLADFAAAHPGQVHLADLRGFLCPGGEQADRIDGEVIRADGVHITSGGVRVVWAWLAPTLRAAAASRAAGATAARP